MNSNFTGAGDEVEVVVKKVLPFTAITLELSVHYGSTSGHKTKKYEALQNCRKAFHKQTQAELFMLEVEGSGSSEAILLEIGKCGKTYN